MRALLIVGLVALTPAAAFAQTPGAGGNRPGGTANQGPSAGDMQRANPPGTSDASGNVSGGQPTQNTGNAGIPVQRGASQNGRPGGEVTRSDSAR
jgi:hypothetical protein